MGYFYEEMNWFQAMSPAEQEAYQARKGHSSAGRSQRQEAQRYDSSSSASSGSGGGLFSWLFGGSSESEVQEQPQPQPRQKQRQIRQEAQAETQQSEGGLPRIVNIGGGNEAQARRVLDRISKQQGYGEDIKKIKEVRITNDLRYPEDHPELGIRQGKPVHGYYVASEGAIYAATDWDLEDTIKHELGHAMKGTPEDYANYYAKRHY